MSDESLQELAALHALGLLEGEQLRDFEERLKSDPELRREVARFVAASAAMTLSAPAFEPPSRLKDRILASASASAASPRKQPSRPSNVIALPWVAWLSAACLAVAAAWALSRYDAERRSNQALLEQNHLAESALMQAREELVAAKGSLALSEKQIATLEHRLKTEGDIDHFKIAALVSMLGDSPEALAVAVWDPSKEEGVLTVSKLPALKQDKDYQLWVVDTQYPHPVNGGVFEVDPATGEARVKFKGDKPIRSIAKFAISLERKGGVPVREGPIVLLSR